MPMRTLYHRVYVPRDIVLKAAWEVERDSQIVEIRFESTELVEGEGDEAVSYDTGGFSLVYQT